MARQNTLDLPTTEQVVRELSALLACPTDEVDPTTGKGASQLPITVRLQLWHNGHWEVSAGPPITRGGYVGYVAGSRIDATSDLTAVASDLIRGVEDAYLRGCR